MKIIRDHYDETKRLCDESIFNCSSGVLGVRGCFEEGAPDNSQTIRGTYLNGFCDTETISYNEKLYGFPESKQFIVNLPDCQGLEFYDNGKKICCWLDNISDYHYCLDMEKGLVSRSFVYNSEHGKIRFIFERFTSFNHPGLFVINCKVNSIDYVGDLQIKSLLNGDVCNFTNSSDPRVASGNGKKLDITYAENDLTISISNITKLQTIKAETLNCRNKVEVYVANLMKVNDKFSDLTYEKEDLLLTANKTVSINANDSINFTKYCYYSCDLFSDEAINELKKAYNCGYDLLLKQQFNYLVEFWKSSRVLINSNDIKQEDIDFSLYEMLCSACPNGKASIAAKGLSGEGYEGHFFWDCEIYIYPFFLLTNPLIAKSLLLYRYSKLDKAKEHAKLLGHLRGALYPWRTITGSECSSHYPSGSAQYHINNDIARAFIQYFLVTTDTEFLPIICETLLEISRLWIDMGHYVNDEFSIDCVTGPDEYTCIVNNNYYTNVGTAYTLKYASSLIKQLMKTKYYNDFVLKTNFDEKELFDFEKAYMNMYYPYDEELGIYKQDDSFLNKKPLNLEDIPLDNFPLLLHYHPLYLYRHQVCKQADTVLANYLYPLNNSSATKRTYDFYESITTHDSSLSKCIFGIMSARLGDLDKAFDYYKDTLSTDLNDIHGNTRDGLHIANMGGCYHMIFGGFAGIDIDEYGLSLFPSLPKNIPGLSFSFEYHSYKFTFIIDNEKVIIKCNNFNSVDYKLSIRIYGQDVLIDKEYIVVKKKCKAVIFDLDGVITNTAVYHYQAWKKIADELNVDFNEKKNESFKGVSRNTCLQLLLDWGNIQLDDVEFNNLLEKKNKYYLDLLNNLTPDSILPGIVKTLDTLHSQGIKVALFSVSKNTDFILDRLGLSNSFDVKVTGKTISNSKPHFEGYLKAADLLSIDPRLCVMVEDSYSGIMGAKQLGLKTIAIMAENTANADFCFKDTIELTNIINYL